MSSERGDEHKRLCLLGEDTDSKESDYSEAPQQANTSRLVPTHQGIEPGKRRKRYQLPKSLQNSILNTSSNTINPLQSRNGPSTCEQAPERG